MDARLIELEVTRAGDEMVFDGIRGVEDAVVQMLVAQLALAAWRRAPPFGHGHEARVPVAGRTYRAAVTMMELERLLCAQWGADSEAPKPAADMSLIHRRCTARAA